MANQPPGYGRPPYPPQQPHPQAQQQGPHPQHPGAQQPYAPHGQQPYPQQPYPQQPYPQQPYPQQPYPQQPAYPAHPHAQAPHVHAPHAYPAAQQQQPYGSAQPAGRSVDVIVSYGARMIASLAIGIPLILVAMYAAILAMVTEPPRDRPRLPSDGPVNPLTISFTLLGGVFLLIPITLVQEKKQIPLRVDANGVTMRNGALLPWAEFQGTQNITRRLRSGGTIDIGVNLRFARGTASLIYRPIKNVTEVLQLVEQMTPRRGPQG